MIGYMNSKFIVAGIQKHSVTGLERLPVTPANIARTVVGFLVVCEEVVNQAI